MEIFFQILFLICPKFLYSFLAAEIANYISEIFSPEEAAVEVI